MSFNLQSPFQPTGDQPQAIQQLVNGIEIGTEITTDCRSFLNVVGVRIVNKHGILPLVENNWKKTYNYRIEITIEKNEALLLTLFDSINSKNYQIKTIKFLIL